jgi:RNA polymerase sigma-70 factor (ECF subfamily)
MPTPDIDASDRAAMARLASGEDRALNELMERHAPSVFRFLCGMLGNEDDANDLAQETFVRVYRARDRFHPEQRFSAWLFTIAGNLARNHLRWRARHPSFSLDAADEATGQSLGDSLPAPEGDPGHAAAAGEQAETVRRAVQQLPEDLREAIVLCEWEDLTVAEAAVILDTTPKAVESRLYRARQILRERLKKWL